ncbi:MAG: lysophospholipid acyltransferase family protein [Acidobacteriota bacterium]|nr:lysophospholipid acyltransferase family protein [Acidobacteriota bacterium]MDQ7088111.1 lysophospholipid acyltransferase family protein [Acidobacteriota bacterium]
MKTGPGRQDPARGRSLADRGSLSPREDLSAAEILRQPLPYGHRPLGRVLARLVLASFRERILHVEGLEHLAPHQDPLILVLNHSQRVEAVLIPTLLIVARAGKLVHFLADWNFRLYPGLNLIFRLSETITVVRKDARPRFLNLLKPLYRPDHPPLVEARRRLEAGAAVGIFPEGTVNRDPGRLLAGHPGAARLSLETGVKVVPAGIRFPEHPPDRPISDKARLALHVGAPLHPPTEHVGRRAPAAAVRSWHHRLMSELARLSGKTWQPRATGGA